MESSSPGMIEAEKDITLNEMVLRLYKAVFYWPAALWTPGCANVAGLRGPVREFADQVQSVGTRSKVLPMRLVLLVPPHRRCAIPVLRPSPDDLTSARRNQVPTVGAR